MNTGVLNTAWYGLVGLCLGGMLFSVQNSVVEMYLDLDSEMFPNIDPDPSLFTKFFFETIYSLKKSL